MRRCNGFTTLLGRSAGWTAASLHGRPSSNSSLEHGRNWRSGNGELVRGGDNEMTDGISRRRTKEDVRWKVRLVGNTAERCERGESVRNDRNPTLVLISGRVDRRDGKGRSSVSRWEASRIVRGSGVFEPRISEIAVFRYLHGESAPGDCLPSRLSTRDHRRWAHRVCIREPA